MPANYAGCLAASDCVCRGTRYLSFDPLTPCPGPTDAQMGHIRKARLRIEKQTEDSRIRALAAADAYIARYVTPSDVLRDWSSSLHAGHIIYGLLLKVRDLESKIVSHP